MGNVKLSMFPIGIHTENRSIKNIINSIINNVESSFGYNGKVLTLIYLIEKNQAHIEKYAKLQIFDRGIYGLEIHMNFNDIDTIEECFNKLIF